MAQLGERMRERGSGKGVYLQAIARALQPLQRPGARKAFLQTLRSVIDTQGQRVSARDRLYLLRPIPTLIVWGGRDHTIPVSHGRRAHEAIPGAGSSSSPVPRTSPTWRIPRASPPCCADFLETTEPGLIEDRDWGQLIAPHSRRRPLTEQAG